MRHAAQTSRLARRFGGELRAVAVAPKRTRTPFEIARENAVEGCVRETYGALVAAWQARTAKDPFVRATLAQIAADEARHAELAWSVARWLEPRLDAADRAAIDEARRAAIEELRSELKATPDAEVVRVAGVPDRTIAAALAERLVAVLFEEAAAA